MEQQGGHVDREQDIKSDGTDGRPDSAVSTSTRAAGERRLILIDDDTLRGALYGFVASNGHNLAVATDLNEADAVLAGEPLELIFVAEHLGDMEPEDIIWAIRDMPGGLAARVVAVSADREPDRLRLAQAGFDAVLSPASEADEILMQVLVAEQAAERVRAMIPPPPSPVAEPVPSHHTAPARQERSVEAAPMDDSDVLSGTVEEPMEIGGEHDVAVEDNTVEQEPEPEPEPPVDGDVPVKSIDAEFAVSPVIDAARIESIPEEAPRPPRRHVPDPEELAELLRPYHEVLETLGFYLGRTTSADREAEHMLHAISEVFPDTRIAIWLRTGNRTTRLARSVGLSSRYPYFAERIFQLLDEEWDTLATAPSYLADARQSSDDMRILATSEEFTSTMTIPLVSLAGVTGVIVLYLNDDERVSDEQMALLETIAAAAAASMSVPGASIRPVEEPASIEAEADRTGVVFQSLLDHLPIPVFVLDPDGNTVVANPAMGDLAGVSGRDLLGLTTQHFFATQAEHVDEQAFFLRQMALSAEPQFGSVGPVPVEFVRYDGGRLPMDLTLSSLEINRLGAGVFVMGVLHPSGAPTDETHQIHPPAEDEAANVEDSSGVSTQPSRTVDVRSVLREMTGLTSQGADAVTTAGDVYALLETHLQLREGGIWLVADDDDDEALALRAGGVADLPRTLTFHDEIVTRLADERGPLIADANGEREIVVPVYQGEQLVGLLDVRVADDPDGQPSGDVDAAILMAAAAQFGGMLERSNLARALNQQAMTDPITGLPNRQAFQRAVEHAVGAVDGEDASLVSMLAIGVDGFKGINDLYGMIVADDILRQMAEVLDARVNQLQRQHDHAGTAPMLARYTSDQFAVLLPGVDRDRAVEIAEQLRIAIWTHLFTAAEQVEQLTVSVGAATCPDDAATTQGLIQAADHAMYLAKRAGRNQVFQSNAAFATLAPAHGRINDLLRQSPKETLSLLIRAMDQRLPGRAGHSERVTRYALAIARRLGVPDAEIPRLRLAAYIHDIGMVSLPDALLRKPGALSEEERHLLHGVPVSAHGLLSQLDLPESVLLSVLHQRENWDGSGYPTALSGENIPLGARIIAVADAIDAMTSARAHREPMSMSEAIAQVRGMGGTQFDPDVVLAAEVLAEVRAEG